MLGLVQCTESLRQAAGTLHLRNGQLRGCSRAASRGPCRGPVARVAHTRGPWAPTLRASESPALTWLTCVGPKCRSQEKVAASQSLGSCPLEENQPSQHDARP